MTLPPSVPVRNWSAPEVSAAASATWSRSYAWGTEAGGYVAATASGNQGGVIVEFGLFNSACVLPQFRGDEHRRIMDEVAVVQAAERARFKYTWATEHHFLTEYSHLSAKIG